MGLSNYLTCFRPQVRSSSKRRGERGTGTERGGTKGEEEEGGWGGEREGRKETKLERV